MSEKNLILLLISAGIGLCEFVLWAFGLSSGLIAIKTWADMSLGALAYRIFGL